jgi:hypothetical protein
MSGNTSCDTTIKCRENLFLGYELCARAHWSLKVLTFNECVNGTVVYLEYSLDWWKTFCH